MYLVRRKKHSLQKNLPSKCVFDKKKNSKKMDYQMDPLYAQSDPKKFQITKQKISFMISTQISKNL